MDMDRARLKIRDFKRDEEGEKGRKVMKGAGGDLARELEIGDLTFQK